MGEEGGGGGGGVGRLGVRGGVSLGIGGGGGWSDEWWVDGRGGRTRVVKNWWLFHAIEAWLKREAALGLRAVARRRSRARLS